MNNSLEMLISLIGEEAKRAVFASFANLRSTTEAPHSFDGAVDKIRKNEIFIAARKANVDMKELKTILIDQYKKQTDQLLEKLSKTYDYACDATFLVNVEKKE